MGEPRMASSASIRAALTAVGAFVGLSLTPLPSRDLGAHAAQDQASVKEFKISARRNVFDPARIEVKQGDLVKITLVAEDGPHSLTIDSYRVSKRASPERNVTIEFRADVSGTHPFYCSLTADNCCRDMRGSLIVH
jgi:plastocyanin